MRRYVLARRRRFIPGTPYVRRRYLAGQTLNRFFRRNVGRYRGFNRRLRTSSLQSNLYYRYRMTPQQRTHTRRRYYRTGRTRLFRMQGRRPRLRHMRTDY